MTGTFEVPIQRERLDNPDWTDNENRQWDTWVNSGTKTASQATADIDKARGGPLKPQAVDALTDGTVVPESMGDQIAPPDRPEGLHTMGRPVRGRLAMVADVNASKAKVEAELAELGEQDPGITEEGKIFGSKQARKLAAGDFSSPEDQGPKAA